MFKFQCTSVIFTSHTGPQILVPKKYIFFFLLKFKTITKKTFLLANRTLYNWVCVCVVVCVAGQKLSKVQSSASTWEPPTRVSQSWRGNRPRWGWTDIYTGLVYSTRGLSDSMWNPHHLHLCCWARPLVWLPETDGQHSHPSRCDGSAVTEHLTGMW